MARKAKVPGGPRGGPGAAERIRQYAAKKGEVRNPQGKNGVQLRALAAEFFHGLEPNMNKAAVAERRAPAMVSRFENFMLSIHAAALQGNEHARELIWYHFLGRPKESMELTGKDGAPVGGPGGGPATLYFVPLNGSELPTGLQPSRVGDPAPPAPGVVEAQIVPTASATARAPAPDEDPAYSAGPDDPALA